MVVGECPSRRLLTNKKAGVFRVLVGPLADGTLNKTKSDLTSSGFPGDKAIKKVY